MFPYSRSKCRRVLICGAQQQSRTYFFNNALRRDPTMDMQLPPALLEVCEPPRLYRHTEYLEFFFSDQLSAKYDPQSRAIWSRWKPQPRPSFNPTLLESLSAYCRFVTETCATIDCMGEPMQVEYTVLASSVPGVFNLGGDLNLFVQLIERRDADALIAYGKACVDVLY